SQTITVTVTDVNEAPAFSSGSFILTIGEDAATDANVGAAVAAVDPDEDGVTYTLTGEDSGDFSIDGNGQITVANPLDHETTSSYTLTVTVTDDDATNSLSATATVTINVTDVNDNAPKITSDNAKKVAENSSGTVLTVTATDADGTGEAIMYGFAGGADDDKFNLGATSGVLTFKSAPDFENPTDAGGTANDNVYVVQVTAGDGVNTSTTQTITITVTDVDEVLGIPFAEGTELYPNPASDHFRLSGISDEWIGVSLIGMTGHLVRSYPVSKDGLYDLSGLSEGLFFVFTEGDEGRKAVGRIVIRK
ncbi:MAG: cadherin domain-containing protein, partial [Ekhidna sp.]|nr:cadherin domain-containing protein [Ekhidna sp.]